MVWSPVQPIIALPGWAWTACMAATPRCSTLLRTAANPSWLTSTAQPRCGDRPPQLQELEPKTAASTTPCPEGRPRKHARLHPDNEAQYLSVEAITAVEFADSNRVVSYRQGSQGKLTARFMMKEVWCWEKGWSKIRRRQLIIRQDAEGAFKWTLTNLGLEAERRDTLQPHDWRQGQRFWIEHAFHEAKSQLDMALLFSKDAGCDTK